MSRGEPLRDVLEVVPGAGGVHAFMVEAIERQAAAAERQRAFHAEALAADAEISVTEPPH